MIYSWLGHTVDFGLNDPTFSVLQKHKTQKHTHTHTHTHTATNVSVSLETLADTSLDTKRFFLLVDVCLFSLTYNTVTS